MRRLIAFLVLFGCETEPTERALFEARPDLGFVAASRCDRACDRLHCENVTRERNEQAEAEEWCIVECLDTEIDCLGDPKASHCGTCEHDAAECITKCIEATDESSGP